MNIGNDALIGLVGFVVAYVVSRVLRERALKRLSVEDKARLLDGFSGHRTFFMSAAVIFPIVYFVAIKSWPTSQALLTPIFFIGFGLLLVVMSWLSFRKLTELNLPKEYIRSFLVNTGIQYLGIAFLFAPLAIRSLR